MGNRALLRGVFLSLREQGLPLGIRDYLDGLRALRAGFGTGGRAELRALCAALWARSEEEVRRLDRLFASLPPPTPREIERLVSGPHKATSQAGPEQVEGAGPTGRRLVDTPDMEEDGVPVDFSRPEQPGGVEIPRAHTRPVQGESFVLSPRPVVSMRSLALAWRRLRKPLRAGPRVELDIDATIEAQCRNRLLAAPVLVPARHNQARLTVLVDVGVGMLPWRDFRTVLAASVGHGQLGSAGMYYFADAPRDRLYRDPELGLPLNLRTTVRDAGASVLIVVSDAGAAWGGRDAGRVRATEGFLSRVRPAWHPVAWLNPMPRRNWPHTPAGAIAGLPGVTMHELTEDGVVAAVDRLRGYHA